MKFNELGLKSELLSGISDQGYENATDIQAKAIPILLSENRDFVGQAQTGTGKTAAFVLPLLDKLSVNENGVQALILTPTRELANQVHEEVIKLGKYTNFKSLPIYGGTSYDKQIKALKSNKYQIVIGTPGRVVDLMNRGKLNFSKSDFLILDEADEMLNMGFQDDLESILNAFNDKKTMWMFSATMPKSIIDMIKERFNNPHIEKVAKKTLTNDDVEQRYYVVKNKYHHEALKRILDTEDDFYGIVFCRTRIDTRELADELMRNGYRLETLNGDMGQSERELAMSRFKSMKSKILVCTDVAARGIDVNNLTHVINYGLSQDLESYVHRIGRTGRAGMKGVAITFVDPALVHRIRKIEQYTKTKMILSKLPSVSSIKEGIVKREVEELASLLTAIKDKGDEFKLDESFEIFSQELEDLNRSDVIKMAFTWKFNKEFKRLNDLAVLDTVIEKKNTREKSRRKDRNNRDSERRKRNKKSVRVFVPMGKDHGLRLQMLLKDISRQVGVHRNDIRNVLLDDKVSFMDVPERIGQELVSRKKLTINKKVIKLNLA